MLAQADPQNNGVGDRITVRELLDKAAAAVENSPALKGREDVEGAIRSTIGNTFFELGLYRSSERHLARAVECQEKASAVVPDLERLTTLNRYLWTLYKEHKYGGLKDRFESTLEECTRALGPEHAETIYAADNLASFYVSSDSPQMGIPIFRKNLEIQERLYGPEHRLTLVAAGNLAAGLLNAHGTGAAGGDKNSMAKVVEAESLAHSTRAAAIHSLGLDSPEALWNATYEAKALGIQGKYAEVAALLRPLQDRFARVFGRDALNTAAAFWELGLAEERLGHLEVAETLVCKAYEVRRDGIGPTIFMTREVLAALIRVEYALGKITEAATHCHELIANTPGFGNADSAPTVAPSIAVEVPSVEALSAALAGKGDPTTVINTVIRLLNKTRYLMGRDDWMSAHLACILIECKHRARLPHESSDHFQRCIDILQSNPSTPARFLAEDRARLERFGKSSKNPLPAEIRP